MDHHNLWHFFATCVCWVLEQTLIFIEKWDISLGTKKKKKISNPQSVKSIQSISKNHYFVGLFEAIGKSAWSCRYYVGLLDVRSLWVCFPVEVLAIGRMEIYMAKSAENHLTGHFRENTITKWQRRWNDEDRGRWTAKLKL